MKIIPWLLIVLLLLVLGMLRRLPLPYTNRASLHVDDIKTAVIPSALFAFLAPASTLTKDKKSSLTMQMEANTKVLHRQ